MLGYLSGILGFALLMGVWLLIQNWVRSESRCARDHDMLEGHGCGGCNHLGACRRDERKQRHGLV